jgi:hypothetical protein
MWGVRVEGAIERPQRACTTRLCYTLWLSLLLLEVRSQLEGLVQEQRDILHRDHHYQTEMRFVSHPMAIKGPTP